MKNWMSAALLSLAVALPLSSYADDNDINQPEIVITHKSDKTFYEYRVNGEVTEIKVVPKGGKPYYLVPVNGSMVRSDRSRLLIPRWVIFQW